MKHIILGCLFPVVLAAPAQADERYTFDKHSSSIAYSVSRFGFSRGTGEFTDYNGEFVFCLNHPEKDHIDITLFPASIRTGVQWMDEELHGPHFFNAARFPTMRFAGTRVKLLDKNNAIITGRLTLLGITQPATFRAHFTEKDIDPDNGDYVVNFSATGVIRRSDFGMDYLIPLLGDEVSLDIKIKGSEEE